MAAASVGVFPHLHSDMIDSQENSRQILDVESGSPGKLSGFKNDETLITELRSVKESIKTFSELKSLGEPPKKTSFEGVNSKGIF